MRIWSLVISTSAVEEKGEERRGVRKIRVSFEKGGKETERTVDEIEIERGNVEHSDEPLARDVEDPSLRSIHPTYKKLVANEAVGKESWTSAQLKRASRAERKTDR
jgi:hypothetical protein